MELPRPPLDTDRKNLIEKLAVFVAKNGNDFEELTRNKQRKNPKFSFLFGGAHSDYYRYRVAAEKTGRLHQQQYPVAQPPLQQQYQGAAVPQQQQTYPTAAAPYEQGYPQPAAGFQAPPGAPDHTLQNQQQWHPGGQLQSVPEIGQPPAPYAQQQPQQQQWQQQQQSLPQQYHHQQQPQQQPTPAMGAQQVVPQGQPAVNGAPTDQGLAEMVGKTGLSADQLTSVIDKLLPTAVAGSVEQLLTALLMKKLTATGLPSAADAAAASTPAIATGSGATQTPAVAATAAPETPVETIAAVPAQAATPAQEAPAPQSAATTGDASAEPAQSAVSSTQSSAMEAEPAGPSDAQPAAEAKSDAEKTIGDDAAAEPPKVDGTGDGVQDSVTPAEQASGTSSEVPATGTAAVPTTSAAPTTAAAASAPAPAPIPAAPAANKTTSAPPVAQKPLSGEDEIAALKKTVRDPDALFALSVAEALKRLPMEGKATLKIAIMEVVAEIRPTEEPAPVKRKAEAEPSKPAADEEEEFSEKFFIGEDAAAKVKAKQAEEANLPKVPPIKKQCVPKSAPFADQLADAKARALAMARQATEQNMASPQAGMEQPVPGYGQTRAAYPMYGQPPPEQGMAPPQQWSGQSAYQHSQQTQPPPGLNGHQLQRPPPAASQPIQYRGPPAIQPVRPLMAGSEPPPQQQQQQHHYPQQQQQQYQQQHQQQQLTSEQIQQQIQQLQHLQQLQQQQVQQPTDQLTLQMQAAAMMGVEPKKENWDQPPQPQQQAPGQQQVADQPHQQLGPGGRQLPAPSNAMPRDPLQRGGRNRRYRSPPRRY